jgi:flagellar hook-associated protein 3 FlgL
VDIGGSGWFTTNHDGAEVFEDTGVFTALDGLSRPSPAAAGHGGQAPADPGRRGLQRCSGVCPRWAPAPTASRSRANVEALDLNLRTLRSDLEDADIEQAVSDLVGRQMAYQSALLATSKIMSTTLADYIR